MAAAQSFLSLEQFERLYGGQKPYVEYWFGEAVPKSMPGSLHGIFQLVLGVLLMRRGWKAASEVRLQLSAVAQPLPDLIADARRIELPSPTQPFDLCVEIISPSDDLRKVFQKAAHYIDWGIGSVWIIDPEKRNAYVMTRERPTPTAIDSAGELTAKSSDRTLLLPLAELFAEVDQVLNG